jgi:predicted esterase
MFVLAGLLLGGTLLWARARDPFDRIWFTVRTPDHGKAKCVAVLPKTAAKPLPVIIYLHGAGGSLLGSGNDLRQMAEMGLATVGIEYNQTNETAFEAQFEALQRYLLQQEWADANAMAWVGFSLGAQRQAAFLLKHPELQPGLLVRLAGGWVPELEGFRGSPSPRPSPPGEGESSASPGPPTFKGVSNVLILHGDQDNVFPPAAAEQVTAVFRTNGVPVDFKILAGQGHNLEPNRALVFRAIGEYCLTQFKGPDALTGYRSIADWRARAKPLWVYSIPAIVWLAIWFLANRHAQATAGRRRKLRPWEIALRWLAAIWATLALGLTAIHLATPQCEVSEKTLALARKYLIQLEQQPDFDFLAAKSIWTGLRLKTLLTHVELANYNRGLVDWKLGDESYRAFVLSPQIDLAFAGELNWRRSLWESFYPRVRREQSLDAAAEIVVRHLRERVTIVEGDEVPTGVESIWIQQITNAKGFERIYVAALRSTGIPARLDSQGHAEFWSGVGWKPAPRPLIESFL